MREWNFLLTFTLLVEFAFIVADSKFKNCARARGIDDNKSDTVGFILKNVAVFFRQNIYIFRNKSNIDDIYNLIALIVFISSSLLLMTRISLYILIQSSLLTSPLT